MTCFNNNSIKTLASLLLGGTAILGTHLGGAFAQDVHMASEPFFEATTHVGGGFVDIESFLWDDRLPSIPVELASSSEGMASAMRSTHGPNPSAAEFEAETSLYGTMFMTLEGAHRIVANDLDWDTPEINWWTMRLDWEQKDRSVVGERELLFFRTQFSYVMQYRITLDAPKRVVLNVGSIDRKGDTDRTLSLSSMELKAVSGFVEDAAVSSGIVAHDTTPLGDFERAFAFDSLPAGDWTIRVMVSASDFEYSADRCDCPQLPCPHTVPIVEEDGYSILSMLQYLDVHPAGGGQSASQPWGAAQMLPLDPALAVEVGNDFDKVTEEANGFGAFLTSSMPAPENNEAAFGFGESFAADPEPWLSLDGTHVQSIIASAQLTAKSEAANAFGTAYAVTHGDFDFEVVMEDTVNLDIKLERSGEDNWDEAAMGTWAYEAGQRPAVDAAHSGTDLPGWHDPALPAECWWHLPDRLLGRPLRGHHRGERDDRA